MAKKSSGKIPYILIDGEKRVDLKAIIERMEDNGLIEIDTGIPEKRHINIKVFCDDNPEWKEYLDGSKWPEQFVVVKKKDPEPEIVIMSLTLFLEIIRVYMDYLRLKAEISKRKPDPEDEQEFLEWLQGY
jgi:hypothetical protein